jgi:hypothetical protein
MFIEGQIFLSATYVTHALKLLKFTEINIGLNQTTVEPIFWFQLYLFYMPYKCKHHLHHFLPSAAFRKSSQKKSSDESITYTGNINKI